MLKGDWGQKGVTIKAILCFFPHQNTTVPLAQPPYLQKEMASMEIYKYDDRHFLFIKAPGLSSI